MNSFDYVRPATVRDAVTAAAAPGAAYLAARTNLLDLMKGGVTTPNRLVDITHLSGLDRIESCPTAASASQRSFATPISLMISISRGAFRRSPRRFCPVPPRSFAMPRPLAATSCSERAARIIYDTASACNKRNAGSGCDAQGGDSRLHAILGWSKSCIATHPSDFCVPLVALDAVVQLEGRTGRREIPLETFHRLPSDKPDRETVLEPGEMIVAVRLPADAARFATNARYLKVRDRASRRATSPAPRRHE